MSAGMAWTILHGLCNFRSTTLHSTKSGITWRMSPCKSVYTQFAQPKENGYLLGSKYSLYLSNLSILTWSIVVQLVWWIIRQSWEDEVKCGVHGWFKDRPVGISLFCFPWETVSCCCYRGNILRGSFDAGFCWNYRLYCIMMQGQMEFPFHRVSLGLFVFITVFYKLTVVLAKKLPHW